MKIPFNRPPILGTELQEIEASLRTFKMSGEGTFNKFCIDWFIKNVGSKLAVMTPSCTAALEMAMILCDIGPGDEVIMPSFTFTSTANAVVLFGGVPVFVDIDPVTLNLDASKIEAAITSRTKAIMPVHYAGIACDMDAINAIAERHKLKVVEDSAQGMFATYKGKALGNLGDMAAVSFHETKNIVCGEGGTLLINNPALCMRAEIVRDKGSNRQQFLSGQVDKYTWQDKGSSYLLPEMAAAFLKVQLQNGEAITARRREIWLKYFTLTEGLEKQGLLRRMIVPENCVGNGHIFFVIVNPAKSATLSSIQYRDKILAQLREVGVQATSHYVPLHSAPAGLKFGKTVGDLSGTTDLAGRLIRLPMYFDLKDSEVEYVVENLGKALR